MRFHAVLVALMFLAAGAGAPRLALAASTLNRLEDPVVLTGADVPSLQGVPPSTVVAFRYNGSWQQIPVQIDERFSQTFLNVYNNVAGLPGNTNISQLVYADADTFTGADPDPNVDADDEIVFMAKDAGDTVPFFTEPAHVLFGSGLQLTITDPLQPANVGYVYLFKQDGTLDPAAGQAYVTYNFNLLSGAYKTTYNLLGTYGTTGNPENTSITTPYYSHHFQDRWTDDELHITAGVANGADILDRHKALFAPGNCVRSENTFDKGTPTFQGEGAFIANRVGPVRAIRSYIGANSGPNTQREHIFYAQRQDIRTYLRVHAIPSIMDFFDYSPAATGMTYHNDLNLGGITIDGTPETPAAGQFQWEMVTGAQGSLVLSGATSTDVPSFSYTSYFLDDSTPITQCTGDAFAYGSSGVYVNMAIPNTDPGIGAANYLNTVRTVYYEPPGLTIADAQSFSARANTPLSVTMLAWTPPVGGIARPVDANSLPPATSGSIGRVAVGIGMLAAGAGLLVMLAVALVARRRSRRVST